MQIRLNVSTSDTRDVALNPVTSTETAKDAPSAAPAFVIDAEAGALIAANAAARKAWGLGPGESTPMAIDRAMPALRRLAAASRRRTAETLTFWTARGLLALDCHVAPCRGDSFLIRALPEGPGAAPQAGAARHTGSSRRSALSRLAHEVRTPLSAAIAYAEVLKDEHFGPLGNARYREYARTIHDSARHALSVVDAMLAGNAVSTGLPELAFRDLDPAVVIEDCVAVTRPLAERAGIDLVACLDRRTPRVIADEVSLKQMLLNLITNGIKFARPGDRVALGAAYGGDGCLRIEVADTGPGMEALGEPAAAGPAGHAGSTGLGIGLPLTRALAEANGATLTVDSAPGHGTRATIAFGKDRVVPV